MLKILLFFPVLILSFISNAQQQADHEPYGKIEVGKGKNKRIIDYDFTVVYSIDTCNDNIAKHLNFWENQDSLHYTAPVFEVFREGFVQYLGKELTYPKYAIENNLTGKVKMHFEITPAGEISNVWIIKGVDISLDKEAYRVIKNIRFKSPAFLYGKAVALCIEMPIRFEME